MRSFASVLIFLLKSYSNWFQVFNKEKRAARLVKLKFFSVHLKKPRGCFGCSLIEVIFSISKKEFKVSLRTLRFYWLSKYKTEI